MDKNELAKYDGIPLKQLPNRVWRTYRGGALIDKWKMVPEPIDGSLPEEWIMSTISARGKNRPEKEGITYVETTLGVVSLSELISSIDTITWKTIKPTKILLCYPPN